MCTVFVLNLVCSCTSYFRCLWMGTSTSLSWAQRAPRYQSLTWQLIAVHVPSCYSCTVYYFCFYSVFWRMSTWVSHSTSASKRWALMVWVQILSTPCIGLQSGQTTTELQQVCPVILNSSVSYMVTHNCVRLRNIVHLSFCQCLCRISVKTFITSGQG